MTHKEIEKQNFVLWYGLYATEKELEMARSNNKETLNRLLREYADEVEKINKARGFYEHIIKSKSNQTQGFDATLRINYFSNRMENTVLEKV